MTDAENRQRRLRLLQLARARAQQKAEQETPAEAPAGDDLPTGYIDAGKVGEVVRAVTDPVSQGLLMGFAPDVGAGVSGTLGWLFGDGSWRENYDRAREHERDSLKRTREANPVLSTGLEIAGALPGAVATGGLGLARAGASAGRRIAQGVGAGAGGGAVASYGEGKGEGRDRSGSDAVLGAIFGGALGGAGTAAGSALRRRAMRRAERKAIADAPTTKALEKRGGAAFEKLKETDAAFSPDTFSEFADDLTRMVADEGGDAVLHPNAMRVLKNIHHRTMKAVGADPLEGITDPVERSMAATMMGEGPALSIKNLMTVRRQLGKAARSKEPDERRIASKMIEKLDEFVEREGGEDVAELWGKGRELWSRKLKSKTLEKLMKRAAKTRVSGEEAALRTEFGTLARNEAKMRPFSPAQRDAIEAVTMGTPGQNILRRLGSIGGGTGASRVGLNAMMAMGLGGAGGAHVAGPGGAAIGAVALPAAGYVAGKMAERGTRHRANLARALAAGGAVKPPSRLPADLVDALIRGMAVPAGGM